MGTLCIILSVICITLHSCVCVCIMQIRGQDISWQHLTRLYERHCTVKHSAPGLSILPKLKYEHIHLTSYSKMRVDLAAQVSQLIK